MFTETRYLIFNAKGYPTFTWMATTAKRSKASFLMPGEQWNDWKRKGWSCRKVKISIQVIEKPKT